MGRFSASGKPTGPTAGSETMDVAELLRRIFEVDPLECPRCGQTMRIVAFITEPQVIDRILEIASSLLQKTGLRRRARYS